MIRKNITNLFFYLFFFIYFAFCSQTSAFSASDCKTNSYQEIIVLEPSASGLDQSYMQFCLWMKLESKKDSPVLTEKDKKDPQIKTDREYGWSFFYFLKASLNREMAVESLRNSEPLLVCDLANGIHFDNWYGKKVSELKIKDTILEQLGMDGLPHLAERSYTLCANYGHLMAQLQVARYNATGFGGVEINCDKAKDFLEKALEQGENPISYRYAGFAYSNGICVPRNSKIAFEYFLKSSILEDPYSSRAVGWSYQYGCGTEKNIKKAINYYEKSAKMNDIEALANLGHIYAFEIDHLDPELSVKYLRKALDLDPGYGFANYFFGLNYLKGRGVNIDTSKAIIHFEKAANAGVQSARYELLDIYNTQAINNIEGAREKLKYWENFKLKHKKENSWSPNLISPQDQEIQLNPLPFQVQDYKNNCIQDFLTENINNFRPYKKTKALIIVNSKYKDASFKTLETTLNDGKKLNYLLNKKFGFEVILLENPIKEKILDTFKDLKEQLTKNDGLLIYYAGHASEKGFMQPIDASYSNEETWLSYDKIKEEIANLNVKDIILILDACYPGAALRGIEERANPNLWESSNAIVAIASANDNQPIQDEYNDTKHSLFAYKFLNHLNSIKKNTKAHDLFIKLRTEIVGASQHLKYPQNPLYSSIYGHEGGDFIFFPRTQ